MRKVTKEYEVYKFNELEKDVQEEVLKKYTTIYLIVKVVGQW